MSDSKVILYDMPSKPGKVTFSPHCWKTRQVLNYKKIPYETEWVELADIQSRFQELGVNKPEGAEKYTVPLVRLPDGSFVMDSGVIAKKLEELYPEPSLHLETGLHDEADNMMPKFAGPLYPVLLPQMRDNALTEYSRSYWNAAREKELTMPVDEFCKLRGGSDAWQAAEPALAEFRGFARKHKRDEGPFVLGSQTSYADMMVVAFLSSAKVCGQDVFDRVVGGDKDMLDLWTNMEKYRSIPS